MENISSLFGIGLNILLVIGVILLLLRSPNRQQEQANNLAFERMKDEIFRNSQEVRENFERAREAAALSNKLLREELAQSIKTFTDTMGRQLADNSQLQVKQSEAMLTQMQSWAKSNEQRLEKINETVNNQLRLLQEDNNKKLEEMRRTVDEKLHETLEKRLGESFQIVSTRLEQVHKGLGEMQNLAAGVGDLKKVLTNVKTRGIWGEVQLEALLEQIMTPDQYAKNIATIPGSSDRVEFAIKLPGRDAANSTVYIPIDAKFPLEDYQNLLAAQEQGNMAAVEEAYKLLATRLRNEAKNIATKYVSVPYTTEFAILFLPIEGLYAEVLRLPGLADELAHKYHIMLAGPTTLTAILNSLQMGFRTLAIEKRSSEVWAILGAVKTEFGKFGDLLDKTSKKLQETGNTIDDAARRTRAIERKLRTVQELPESETIKTLGDDFYRDN